LNRRKLKFKRRLDRLPSRRAASKISNENQRGFLPESFNKPGNMKALLHSLAEGIELSGASPSLSLVRLQRSPFPTELDMYSIGVDLKSTVSSTGRVLLIDVVADHLTRTT